MIGTVWVGRGSGSSVSELLHAVDSAGLDGRDVAKVNEAKTFLESLGQESGFDYKTDLLLKGNKLVECDLDRVVSLG
jgi:hypothetical protein